jgi:3-oxoacyl-[acyl-carrier protein] reductase
MPHHRPKAFRVFALKHSGDTMAKSTRPLARKVALVIGGSRGMGAAIARRLAADGARVAITYLSNGRAARAVVRDCEKASRAAMAVKADAGNVKVTRAAIQKVVKKFGRLDILVYSPVSIGRGPLPEITESIFNRAVNVNLKGLFFAVQEAALHMAKGGRIITIGSVFSEFVPGPGLDIYTMSKAAMVGLVKAWSQDLASKNITVNCIQPGPIHTDMNDPSSEFGRALASMTILKRHGEVTEIAGFASYLAGPDGGYVTGAALNCDGGMTV